ncbi:MAG: hypothetical protein Q8R28_00845 [Dehalococcoidia bacterium]|nr:hypothetical protein [Dehalococcoidia bacterium]
MSWAHPLGAEQGHEGVAGGVEGDGVRQARVAGGLLEPVTHCLENIAKEGAWVANSRAALTAALREAGHKA